MWACASESATQDILHKKAKKIEIMPSLLAPTAAADPTQALLAYPRDDSQTSEDHGPGSNHPIEPGEAALSGLGSTIRKATVAQLPFEQQTLPAIQPSQSFFRAL